MSTERDLLDLSRCLRGADRPTAVLRAVTDRAAALTGSAHATLRLLRPQTGELRVAARTGPAMQRGGGGRFSANRDRSLLGLCVSTMEPAWVRDPASDVRFVRRGSQQWMPTAVMVAPLCTHERAIGVLSVARSDGCPYTDQAFLHLQVLAELAAPHVEVERLGELAETDALTLLHNRHHLEKRLPALLRAAERHARPLSAILVDLDHFGNVNNDWDHVVGDRVLAQVAARMRAVARLPDVLVRLGGDEFLVLLPETASADALALAERLRLAIRAGEIGTTEANLEVTASLGVCAVHPGDDQRTITARLDVPLQRAKREGRDRALAERPPFTDEPLRGWNDFFDRTRADYLRVEGPPDRAPDFESQDGSRYWNAIDGVYRASDHWSEDIHGSAWLLDGAASQKPATGYAPYTAFRASGASG